MCMLESWDRTGKSQTRTESRARGKPHLPASSKHVKRRDSWASSQGNDQAGVKISHHETSWQTLAEKLNMTSTEKGNHGDVRKRLTTRLRRFVKHPTLHCLRRVTIA